MAVYRPDPGGVFKSDTHRRVLAALPTESAVELGYALDPVLLDANIPFNVRDVDTLEAFKRVLQDLRDEGYVALDGDAVKRTVEGTAALEAGEAVEPDPISEALVAERERANAQKAVYDNVRQAESRIAANEAALEEIHASIAEDRALIEAAEAEDQPVEEVSAE
jgi:hypothetical protein